MMFRDTAFLRRFLCTALFFVSIALPVVAQTYIEECIRSFVRWEASTKDFYLNQNHLCALADVRLNQKYKSIVFVRKGNRLEVTNIQDEEDQRSLQGIADILLPTTPTPDEDRIEFAQTEKGRDILAKRPSLAVSFITRSAFPNEPQKEELEVLKSLRYQLSDSSSANDQTQTKNKDDLVNDESFVDVAIEVSWDEDLLTKRLRYPQFLQSVSIEGYISLRLYVSEHGVCQRVSVMNSHHPEFLLSGLVAINDFPFSPANDGVNNVGQWITLPVAFKLR